MKSRKIKEKFYHRAKRARFTEDDAQEIGEYLERKKINTRDKLLKDAKNPESILHKYFEWEDKRAAHLYRLKVANDILSHLTIEITFEDGGTSSFKRGFEVITDKKAQTYYIPAEQAMSDDEFRNQVLLRGWKVFNSWQEHYSEFKEFKPIFDAAKEVEKKLKELDSL